MTDNKNTILAIVLSALVLIGWQYFFAMPQEKARQEQLQAQQQGAKAKPATAERSPASRRRPSPPSRALPPVPGQAAQPPAAAAPVTRAAALAASPRVPIATDSLQGSIALKGGRIDDLALVKFRETVDPKSPPIVLLSPSGSPDPFYAEFGWTNAAGANVKVPNTETVWTQSGSGALSVGHPVTLTYNNGQGLEFRRTIAVDDKYLFTTTASVNAGAPAIAHLVEIVDADRCERGPGAEDRIRERMIDAVQGLGEELPDATALLRLVRKLAQHDRSLAIEIADRRSGGGQPCHGGECRRDIGRHDDRIDRRLLTRRRRPELAAEALDLAPGSRPSRVRKIRCSCRCAPPRAAPCREPTPTVSRAATTGPGRSSAATRSPASVRPMIGTGQPGVVLRACSTVATYATCVPGCKSWSRAAPLPSCFGQRVHSCFDPPK